MTHDTFIPVINHTYAKPAAHPSVIHRFAAWCNAQQSNRLLWMGAILALHGCVLTPAAMLLTLMGSGSGYLFIGVIIAMAMNLIPNLAALPTKITIPVFMLSVLIDVLVIAAAWA